mmetsp:Transcript_10623/g.25660  ORF Transcript_10623/g.25660 Transcript_10623/m.25660 type:complete len:165 (-) Transcript_10623:541-1035(-)
MNLQSIILLVLGNLTPTSSFFTSSSKTPVIDSHLKHRVPTHLSLSNDYLTEDSLKRRSFLLLSCATLCVTLSSSASNAGAAADVRAPSIELRLPAIRVKLYIDQVVELCKRLKASESTSLSSSLAPLKDLLENEPTFMTEKEQKLSKRYLEIKTTAAWQDARRN